MVMWTYRHVENHHEEFLGLVEMQEFQKYTVCDKGAMGTKWVDSNKEDKNHPNFGSMLVAKFAKYDHNN